MANATVVDLATPEVDIDLIHIVEGHNPRTHFDEDDLERLAADIRANGIIEPLVVVPVGDHFDLVAGERRLRAARKAGLKKAPVTTRRDGNRAVEAAAENDHREDLDVVATGRSWKAVAQEHNLTTNAAIAERVNRSAKVVGDHLRLLKLPDGVQRYFADGVVPITAEKPLREISKVSPRVAECVCEVARRERLEPSRFVATVPDLLLEAAGARFDDPPTMVPVVGVSIAKAIADRKVRENIRGRLEALFPDETVTVDAAVSFSDEEVDAARAAGCLLERERGQEWMTPIRFVTDAEFAADLVDRVVSRMEVEVPEARRLRVEREQREKACRRGVDPDAGAEKQSEERKEQAAERKARQVAALAWNEEVGRRLLKGRGGRARKQRGKVRSQVVADLLLAAYPDMAARGLRLALPQLREVETKRLKSGEPRTKITYAEPDQARNYLATRIAEAGSPEERLELITEALVAATLADEEVLPQSQRIGRDLEVGQSTQKALAADLKAATPRSAAARR
jgi:ParB/RepB/Spo0J family partition protein